MRIDPAACRLPGVRLVLPLLLLTLVGCERRSAPGESAEEVCELARHGHKVAVSGYLAPPGVLVACESKCLFYLSASRRSRPYEGVAVDFTVGDGPGRMRPLPRQSRRMPRGSVEEVRLSNIRFTATDGTAFNVGEWIRVEGVLDVRDIDGKLRCTLEPDQIALP